MSHKPMVFEEEEMTDESEEEETDDPEPTEDSDDSSVDSAANDRMVDPPDTPEPEPQAAVRPRRTLPPESREKIRQSQLAQTPEQREKRRRGIQLYHSSRPYCKNGLHAKVSGAKQCAVCRAATAARYAARHNRAGSVLQQAEGSALGAIKSGPLGSRGKAISVPVGGEQGGEPSGAENEPIQPVLPVFEYDERFLVMGGREPNLQVIPRIDIIRELRLLSIAILDRLGFGPPRECQDWTVVNNRVLFQSREEEVRPDLIQSQKLIGSYDEIARFGSRGTHD